MGIKAIFKSILYKSGLLKKQKSCWEKYKDYIKIHPTAIIAPQAGLTIFNLPDKPEILFEVGEYSHIFGNFSILRDKGRIKIGKRCQIGDSLFICSKKITLKDDILMAWGCTLMDNDSHSLRWQYRQNDVLQCYNDYLTDRNNFIRNKDWTDIKEGEIEIGSKSWIGFNVSILKNVKLAENTIVGVGSVVTKGTSSNCIIAGNPAIIIDSSFRNGK